MQLGHKTENFPKNLTLLSLVIPHSPSFHPSWAIFYLLCFLPPSLLDSKCSSFGVGIRGGCQSWVLFLAILSIPMALNISHDAYGMYVSVYTCVCVCVCIRTSKYFLNIATQMNHGYLKNLTIPKLNSTSFLLPPNLFFPKSKIYYCPHPLSCTN